MKKQFRLKAKRRFVDREQSVSIDSTIQHLAAIYARMMKYLAPLIKRDSLAPGESAILVACYSDAVMVGNDKKAEHTMSEDDIHSAVNLFLRLWKDGRITVPADYPHTLEETLREEVQP